MPPKRITKKYSPGVVAVDAKSHKLRVPNPKKRKLTQEQLDNLALGREIRRRHLQVMERERKDREPLQVSSHHPGELRHDIRQQQLERKKRYRAPGYAKK